MELLAVAIILLFNAIGCFLAWKLRHRLYSEISEAIKNDIVNWLNEPENQQAIQSYVDALGSNLLEKLKMAIIGQKGGITKGINHQLRSLEKEIIAQGLDAAAGFPGVGQIAVEYLDKYPVLKAMLPYIVQQIGSANPGGPKRSSGAELGKI